MAAWRAVCGVSVMLAATPAWGADGEGPRRPIGVVVKEEVRELGEGVKGFFREFREGFREGMRVEPPAAVVEAVEQAPPGTVIWVSYEGVTIWVPE